MGVATNLETFLSAKTLFSPSAKVLLISDLNTLLMQVCIRHKTVYIGWACSQVIRNPFMNGSMRI